MPKMPKIVVSLRSAFFYTWIKYRLWKTRINFKPQKSESNVSIIEGWNLDIVCFL